MLAFLIVPIFVGIDDTLDPRRFALLGIDRTRLAVGLTIAGVVGVPGPRAAARLVRDGRDLVAVAARGRSSRSSACPCIVLTCVLLSRIGATSAGLLLSTRRSREAVAAVLVILLSRCWRRSSCC